MLERKKEERLRGWKGRYIFGLRVMRVWECSMQSIQIIAINEGFLNYSLPKDAVYCRVEKEKRKKTFFSSFLYLS
jgi:hypothetical protein